MVTYRQTVPADETAIEALLDRAFGADRRQKTAYRLRAHVAPIEGLSLVAEEDGQICGTIAYAPVQVRMVDRALPALLLGPLAVDPDRRGEGVGIKLMEKTLASASEQGHELVLLVGDLDYYSRVGFSNEQTPRLRLPGPVDQERVLARFLNNAPVVPLEGDLAPIEAEDTRAKQGLSA